MVLDIVTKVYYCIDNVQTKRSNTMQQLTNQELDQINNVVDRQLNPRDHARKVVDRQQTILEAMQLLAEAEELVRSLNSSYLNGYVAGHINSRNDCLGDGLYQLLEKELLANE